MLPNSFFDRDATLVAKNLLGKIIRHYHQGEWLSAKIIETEAYYLTEKASHASLGFTEKRKALFMSPGTIYMYYARGGDSINVSCRGEGNAVLIKSGIPYTDETNSKMIAIMQTLNPVKDSGRLREAMRLCCGQTLLCRSLGLKVPHWNQKNFDIEKMRMDDVGYKPTKIIQTTRLGIPPGRDEHLPYRFIDFEYANFCTDNPLKKRRFKLGRDYFIHEQ